MCFLSINSTHYLAWQISGPFLLFAFLGSATSLAGKALAGSSDSWDHVSLELLTNSAGKAETSRPRDLETSGSRRPWVGGGGPQPSQPSPHPPFLSGLVERGWRGLVSLSMLPSTCQCSLVSLVARGCGLDGPKGNGIRV